MAVLPTLTTYQLDDAGKVVAKGTWRSIVRPGDPQPLEYTSERMEGKLSFFKAGAEEPAPTKTTGTPAPKSKVEPEKNQAESAVEAVRKYNLRDRYLWKRLPDENAAGESAYVIAFEPKPKQNTKSREERFFGLLAGKLWVSRSDFTVLKAEAALQSPSQLFWIIARVTTFQMTYEVEPARAGNRLLRLTKATAKTVVTFPFYSVRQKHWQRVDKYEPIGISRRSAATRAQSASDPEGSGQVPFFSIQAELSQWDTGASAGRSDFGKRVKASLDLQSRTS